MNLLLFYASEIVLLYVIFGTNDNHSNNHLCSVVHLYSIKETNTTVASYLSAKIRTVCFFENCVDSSLMPTKN